MRYVQPGAVQSGIFGGFGAYVQPGAVRSGVFGGFGHYVQPGAIRDGVFGAMGASDLTPLTQTVDGLTFFTPASQALWQAAMQLSACPVPAPTADVVLQLSTDPSCQSLQAALAAAPPGSVALISPADLMLAGAAAPGSAPGGNITITSNPQVVAQLASTGFAIADTPSTGNAVVASAKNIAKGAAGGAKAGAVVAAHAFGIGTTALIALGVGGVIWWAFKGKKRR